MQVFAFAVYIVVQVKYQAFVAEFIVFADLYQETLISCYVVTVTLYINLNTSGKNIIKQSYI